VPVEGVSKVLVVCMGNICRSPTAVAVLRAKAAARGRKALVVEGAGTVSHHVGDPPDERSQRHAAKRGYDLSALRARRVAPGDFAAFDVILAADAHNLDILRRECPAEHTHKLGLFLDALGEAGREVPDPYYGGPAGFEAVLDLCEAASTAWLDRWFAADGRHER